LTTASCPFSAAQDSGVRDSRDIQIMKRKRVPQKEAVLRCRFGPVAVAAAAAARASISIQYQYEAVLILILNSNSVLKRY